MSKRLTSSTPSERKLTRRQALQVLIDTAQTHLRGSGTGLAERPSPVRAALIKAAAERVWRDAYYFEFPKMWPQ